MRQGYCSVVDKEELPHGINPHEYRSLAPFWWPNPASDDGLPYVQHAGKANPEALTDRYDARRFEILSNTVFDLALQYTLTGDMVAGKRAATLLRIWFVTPETAMLPNMDTAGIRPGIGRRFHASGIALPMRGTPDGIMESRLLLPLCDAIPLLDDPRLLSHDDMHSIRQWMRAFLHWMDTAPNALTHGGMTDGNGTWNDAVRMALLIFLGDTEAADHLLRSRTMPRINVQFAPDGSQPWALVRGDSLSESLGNLEAWAAIAIMGQRLGVEVWHHSTPEGASVSGGWDFVQRYHDNLRRWPWPQHPPLEPSRLETLERTVRGLTSSQLSTPSPKE